MAAKHAFWNFDKPLLDKIVDHAGLESPAGSSLCEQLLSMVMQVLQCDEDEGLNVIAVRLDVKSGTGSNLDDFLQLDEAAACLDTFDQKDLKDEQDKISTAVGVCKEFKLAWATKRQAVRAAPKGRGKGAGRGGGGAAAKAKAKARAKMKLPVGIIEQSEAKKYAPAGGFVWRANNGQSWQGHYRPYARVSKSWHLYGGNRNALILVLRELWMQHLEFVGERCPEDCLVVGLFSDAGPAELV
jgi:hypothetical protein